MSHANNQYKPMHRRSATTELRWISIWSMSKGSQPTSGTIRSFDLTTRSPIKMRGLLWCVVSNDLSWLIDMVYGWVICQPHQPEIHNESHWHFNRLCTANHSSDVHSNSQSPSKFHVWWADTCVWYQNIVDYEFRELQTIPLLRQSFGVHFASSVNVSESKHSL